MRGLIHVFIPSPRFPCLFMIYPPLCEKSSRLPLMNCYSTLARIFIFPQQIQTCGEISGENNTTPRRVFDQNNEEPFLWPMGLSDTIGYTELGSVLKVFLYSEYSCGHRVRESSIPNISIPMTLLHPILTDLALGKVEESVLYTPSSSSSFCFGP